MASPPPVVLAPLDYRYALDAAMSLCAGCGRPAVICNIPELLAEIDYRVPSGSASSSPGAAVWIEPLGGSYRDDLASLHQLMPAGGMIAIVASLPMARILPERRAWEGGALGMHVLGVRRLTQSLVEWGFVISSRYGIHTPTAIGLHLVSRQFERRGRADLGGRAHFAARLRYATDGPLAMFSTVALLTAVKGG